MNRAAPAAGAGLIPSTIIKSAGFTIPSKSLFLEVARELALAAARRIQQLRLQPLQTERKADYSIVTNADREADQIIRSGLREAFPDHAILTEESGMEGARAAEYVWVVDPVDGTRAYVKGVAGFSVMIGLLRNQKPFAGVVVDPWEGHLYEAECGRGAFHQQGTTRTALRVSARRDLQAMSLVTSTGFPESWKERLQGALPCPWIPAINSVGIKVGLLVRQVADIYLNHHAVHFWDTCAPELILEEAGGRFTYLDGRPLAYNLQGDFRHASPTLASNGTRHADLIGLIGATAL